MGSLVVGLTPREVLEHRQVELMSVSVGIRQQESLVNRIPMKRVARGQTAGLELLSLSDINISSKRNFSTPVLPVFISAFPGGHEILRSSQASSQIGGVFERKKVDVPFVGRWKTCDLSEIFLTHQLVQGLTFPKERHRARNVCTNGVYCTARVGTPGCRSLESLPWGGERSKTFKVRRDGGNGWSEEGGTTP